MILGVNRLEIPDVVVFVPRRFEDSRGYFVETYRRSILEDMGIDINFVQENQSYSVAAGTIRALHFQRPPVAQAKLVRVLRGSILDVAVDLRRGSPTYGKWVGAKLTAAEGQQMLVPRGFAHGFCTLEPHTEALYKCDAYYAPEHEGGLHFADPDIQVSWPVSPEAAIVSDKDAKLPAFDTFETPFAL